MGMLSLSEGFVSVMDKDIQAGTFVIDMKPIVSTDTEGRMKDNLEAHLKVLLKAKKVTFLM
ncbi:MAG: tRNA (Thr-GGU) A37 N-methylase [Saprospiraceae bacterium]|jgi:tRNA (Thr-GGU) A37 N-methylase